MGVSVAKARGPQFFHVTKFRDSEEWEPWVPNLSAEDLEVSLAQPPGVAE